MPTTDVTSERTAAPAGRQLRSLASHAWSILGLIAVALMLVWAVHDGGYDADTWYWGALGMLSLLTAVVLARGPRAIRLSRAAVVALSAFALYVGWSYLSISWAASPGDALTGSNRALLYLLIFATMLVLPWTVRGALIALVVFALGVGVVAVVLLVRLASADHVGALLIDGRLAAPTGYFNSTAALFTIEALVAVALASRRELPGLLRGALIGFACAGLQLAVIVQSRGWLFTLPLILLAAIAIVPDRLRVAAAAVIPAAAALVPLHRLLHVYRAAPGAVLNHAARQAGHSALLLCALAFVVGTLIAWGESLMPVPQPSRLRRRVLGSIAVLLAAGATLAGALAVSHGHPFRFISRQWHGFSHQESTHAGSHFTDVGSGRYDFWRVALDAFVAHPVGGLGQDNFVEYYVPRRRTGEEPSWTHSLELRLLAHTGAVGFVLFAAFVIAALVAALPARRLGGLAAAVAGAALLPLVVWLIHGSIDWFWEMPALTGPALGFLGMTGALAGHAGGAFGADDRGRDVTPSEPAPSELPPLGPTAPEPTAAEPTPSEPTPTEPGPPGGGPVRAPSPSPTHAPSPSPTRRVLTAVAGAVALLAATAVLAFPYLSVREVSVASDLRGVDPVRALAKLQTAADLDPLSASPARLAGTIALQNGRYGVARERFKQVTSRDPGDWYGWLGAGLAASALRQPSLARHDFEVAGSIKRDDRVIDEAIARVDTAHPLSPVESLQMLASES